MSDENLTHEEVHKTISMTTPHPQPKTESSLAPANGSTDPMHPLEFLRRNGWKDYETIRRVWIDPKTAQHFEESEALKVEFKRQTGCTL